MEIPTFRTLSQAPICRDGTLFRHFWVTQATISVLKCEQSPIELLWVRVTTPMDWIVCRGSSKTTRHLVGPFPAAYSYGNCD